jgi:hypothetical protein
LCWRYGALALVEHLGLIQPDRQRAKSPASGCEQISALADRGYGVAPVVPKPLTSSGAKRDFFIRPDFIYDAKPS